MIVNTWVEPYTLTMGIHMMDVLIETLCVSGLVYAPFVVAIGRAIVKSMTEGDDEGNAGELAFKFLRKDLLVMGPVFFFAFIPFGGSDVTFDMKIANYSCDGAQSVHSAPTDQQSQMLGNFTNTQNKIPMWWMLTHDYSSTLTNTVIASMPCAADLTMAKTNLSTTNLQNTYDQNIAKAWQSQCLSPAMSTLSQAGAYNQKLWAGHDDLRTLYRKESRVVEVPIETANQAGLTIPQGNTGATVKVNCDAVYQHIENAAVASARSLSPESLALIKEAAGDSEITEQQLAMSMVAKITPTNVVLDANGLNNLQEITEANVDPDISISDLIPTLAAWVGTAIGNVFKAPSAVVQKQSMPIIISVLEMLLLSTIPLLLVFSGFDWKTMLAISGLYLGLEYTLVIISMGAWVDNTLTLFFYSTGSTGLLASMSGTGSATTVSMLQSAILTNVAYTCYDLLPKVWMALMSYLGVKSGSAMMAGATASDIERGVQSFSQLNQQIQKISSEIGKKAADVNYSAAKRESKS